MSRLIDADALRENMQWAIDHGMYDKPYDYLAEIDDTPTIDAVEVVRCGDCLMTKERDEHMGKVWCCRHREYMDDMYYCADGLRREDGEA